MFKMMRTLTLAALLVGLAWSHTVLAADVPTGATKNDELSAIALTKAKEVFAAQKEKLTQQLETDTTLEPSVKDKLSARLAQVEHELQTLASMEVYFVDESAPGAAYDDAAAFYQDKLNNFTNVGSEELTTLLDTPVEIMPQATKDSLEQMINDGSARAAAGNSGSSRVSIMTFYVHPDTLELIHKTTIVVATTK